jgi:hypothetical protein
MNSNFCLSISASGCRKQEAGSRKQEAGSRKQEAGGKEEEGGSARGEFFKRNTRFHWPID